jgi:2-polyprenyl-6-methoxyphenol hydroxylase-like FAD-dependent oxidoreductase
MMQSAQLPETRHPIPDTPVLIVGAGPTGLTLAIELARRGIPFRLIDRDARRAETSRAIGTQARTIEVFRIMGIPASALHPAVWPRALRFAELDRTLARLVLRNQSGASLQLASMDESDTERVLEERLAQLGGRIEQSSEMTAFRIDGDQVIATVQTPQGESRITAHFLIGADGAHSAVRRGAGIGFAGEQYPERFLLVDLDIDWDLAHDEGHVWIGDDGLVAAIPLPGEGRYRVIVPLPPEDAEREYASEAEIAALAESLLRQRSGIALRRVGDPVWASAFRIQRRQAERYRAGPVFLAGEAAHVHSPVGGQGMNTGIQDAFNLGWKLALAVRRLAAPGLLDTYEAERYPIARGVLQGTHLGTRIALARHPVMRTLREYVVPAVTRLAPIRRRFLAAISQVGIGYRGSTLAIDAAPAEDGRGWLHRGPGGIEAGDRVPDLPLVASATGEQTMLYELIARGWILLCMPGRDASPDGSAACERIVAVARETVGREVQGFLVASASRELPAALPMLLDPTGDVGRIFGAGSGLVVLIRPDGYLGFRGHPDQAGELASYLARIFAMQLREPATSPGQSS